MYDAYALYTYANTYLGMVYVNICINVCSMKVRKVQYAYIFKW